MDMVKTEIKKNILNLIRNADDRAEDGPHYSINGSRLLHHENQYTWIPGRADYTFTQRKRGGTHILTFFF